MGKGFFPACREEIVNDGSTEFIISSHIINLSTDDHFQVNSFYLAMSPGYKTFQDTGHPQIGRSPNKGCEDH